MAKAVLKESPNNVESRYYLGHALAEKKEWQKALQELERAKEDNPKSIEVINTLAWVYREKGMFQDSKILTLQVIKMNPKDKYEKASAYSNLGEIYLINKESEKALEAFKQSIKYNEELVSSYLEIGIIYCEKGSKGKVLKVKDRLKNTYKAFKKTSVESDFKSRLTTFMEKDC